MVRGDEYGRAWRKALLREKGAPKMVAWTY